MIDTLIFLPVAAKDAVRVGYAVRSIRKYADNYRIYLLLDGQDAASLPADVPGDDIQIRSATNPSGGNWGKIWALQAQSMIEAHQEGGLHANAVFIRMDSDAVIVRRGFTARAQRIFSTRPKAGQIGQTFSNVRGARFSNAGWVNYLDKMTGARGLFHFARAAAKENEGASAGLRAHKEFRSILKQAEKNGYVLGDLCLGGFNVMRREMIAAMAEHVRPKESPFRFLPILGDDIVMSIYAYWLGYAPIDDSSDDGICGIEAAAFRVDPFALKARGHYALHPLKYGYKADGYDLTEADLFDALVNPQERVLQ